MRVDETYMEHDSGTKFYRVTLIANAGRSVLIKRWGKVGKRGEHKIEFFPSLTLGNNGFNETIHGKSKRGYTPSGPLAPRVVSDGTAKLIADTEAGSGGNSVMEFLGVGRMPDSVEEVEIVSENPTEAEVRVDRSGDSNWGTW